MDVSNTQMLLLAILVLAILFVLAKCKLQCKGGSKELWSNQIRDQVSNPFAPDILSSCNLNLATPRLINCPYSGGQLGGWDRSEPLTERAQKLAYFEEGQDFGRDFAALQEGGALD